MLPIDEHAKSGAWVWVFGQQRSWRAFWSAEEECWQMESGALVPEFWATHYLPVPWVENAAKMREDLRLWSETCPEEKSTAEILAATTWPEVKG